MDRMRDAHKNFYRRRLLRRLPIDSVCAEIGVWSGEFSHLILKSRSPKELHLIDPWMYMPDREGPRYGTRLEGGQTYMDALYQDVLNRFAENPEVRIHRKTSIEAAEDFPDACLDWIYLDADHSYEATRADLESWLPKLKNGGFISGDDYTTDGGWWGDGVVRAVDEIVASAQIDKLSLVGTQFLARKL